MGYRFQITIISPRDDIVTLVKNLRNGTKFNLRVMICSIDILEFSVSYNMRYMTYLILIEV